LITRQLVECRTKSHKENPVTTEQTVEVRLAFAFDCPNCGKENFVSSVMHEFTREEQEEMTPELGERPQTGKWVTHPERVTCQACNHEFVALNPGEAVEEKKG
jgi:transcription elongation factor Elf1